MMILLDGRVVAQTVYETLAPKIAALRVPPVLTVVLVGNNPASEMYVSRKAKAAAKLGIGFRLERLPVEALEDEVVQLVERINADSSVHACIVQLPLPSHIDAQAVIQKVHPSKDVDGLTIPSAGNTFFGRDAFASCTPKGVLRLLSHYQIDVSGKTVAMIGRSNIVGKPLSLMLINAGATLIACNSKTQNLAALTSQADIVIVAIGSPKFLTPAHVKKGAVVIDVGSSRTPEGMRWDADYEALFSHVSAITPVPGGVWPMTVAMLMENTYLAALRQQ